jgi:hypothetical protein
VIETDPTLRGRSNLRMAWPVAVTVAPAEFVAPEAVKTVTGEHTGASIILS